MNSKITFYYLHKSGASEKIRYTSSMYRPNRSILVQDDHNSIIWIFHGPNTHSETIRLENYGIEEVNLMLKYRVVKIGHDEIEDVLRNIVAIYKNSKDKDADIFLKTIIGAESAAKLKKKEKPSESMETRSLKPMSAATLPVSKKVIAKKSAPSPTESKIAKPPGYSAIPAPPSSMEKETDDHSEFVLKADFQTGPIIDSFNIAYYEKSGGSNFVLVEELHESFKSEHFEKLSNFVKLINKLKLEKYTRTQAKANLNSEYNKLIDDLF